MSGRGVAPTTIKNDVACFIRTYVPQQASRPAGNDDALESPLTELGLIKAIGRRDGFRFVRGPKPSLGRRGIPLRSARFLVPLFPKSQ